MIFANFQLDNADLDLEEGEVPDTVPVTSLSNEIASGKEQMIKEGNMTPFGTVVKSVNQSSLLYKQLTCSKAASKFPCLLQFL